MQEEQATHPIGAVILGHYTVENVLSKSSSGAIYLVTDQRHKRIMPNSPRFLALKEVINPHKQERYRLISEGALLRRLRHHALPRFYRVFSNEEQGRAYLPMEYIAGPNLETLRQQQREQRYLWSEIITLMAPIIDAVTYLHHQQPPIVHGDIKPANIIVSNLEGARAVLVDFGTIKHLDPTANAVRPYSPGYRAPEQCVDDFDTRTDVYGLGATFYTLITGIVPPDGFSRLTQVGNEEVDSLKLVHEVLPTVPMPVAKAIDRAMFLDVPNRFSSVEQFWETLWEVTDTLPMSQPAPVLSSIPSPSSSPPFPLPIVRERVVEHTSVTPLRRMPPVERPRVPFPGKPGILLIVLALVIGLGVGVGFEFRALNPITIPLEGSTPQPSLLTPTITVTLFTPTLTSTSTTALTPTLAPTPTAVPTPTATSVSTGYSTLAGTYNGTIYDIPANVHTTMSLTFMQQNPGIITGYLMLGPRLQGSGQFSGTIDTAKRFQFSVRDAAGHTMFFFEGAVLSAGRLSGDFYGCNSYPRNPCPHGPDSYGIWNVTLAGSASS